MASGLWPAVSGAVAKQQMVDSVANNLANVNTDGYKKDQPTFKEYLAAEQRPPNHVGIQPTPITDKDLHRLEGKDQAFVVNDATYIDFTQGNLKVTHNPLDLALDGVGFFEVNTPEGVRYTRHGSFKLAKDGRLVTTQGFPVLASQAGGLANALPPDPNQPGQGGQPTQGGVAAGLNQEAFLLGPDGQPLLGPDGQPIPLVAARYVQLGGLKGPITISANGEIYSGDEYVQNLSVVEFPNRQLLRKQEGQLFQNPQAVVNPSQNSTETRVRQGMIETSNVNPVEEMSKLIKAHRLYEHDLKSIRTYDELLSKEANEVGKL